MASTSRASATSSPVSARPDDKAQSALALMIEALELIDSSNGATVAGAHLDLAIHRLREWIDENKIR